MAYWVSAQIDTFAGKQPQGWFDIPNGWTADSFGVVAFQAASSYDQGGDSELYIHGFCVSGSHMGKDHGYTHSCACPRGGVVTCSTNRGINFFRYRRLGS